MRPDLEIMENDKLISQYAPLVKAIASKYRNYGIPMDDLIQEGYIGILDAWQRYDSGKGAKFSTYASFWVKKKMIEALNREKGETMNAVSLTEELQVPSYDSAAPQSMPLPEGMPDIEALVFRLLFKECKTLKEISRELNMPGERIRQIKQKALRRIKINKTLTQSLYSINNP
ncbi:MAG: hypothetical protein A2219_01620 [Elusimicrobia bacterium RIFOXYA2_FULL_50_26]|nr:MAG: hypothetical protein A2219_01620 [Elusimicrobia bacterium RIFOXYA2_FULL_50_26]OGS22816.1 MAG: hypothetical protein A2314_03930 [Elusimicrobia bacterium RIFOXYB2_FULL_50_12]